jgi:hypothetical protein
MSQASHNQMSQPIETDSCVSRLTQIESSYVTRCEYPIHNIAANGMRQITGRVE